MSNPQAGAERVLDFDSASALVAEHARRALESKPARERVALLDALGRVTAAEILADRDQPAFRRSMRDGFACRAEDAHGKLSVVGLIKAGETYAGTVAPGQAVEIMTGAPVPPGADSVVMVEHVLREENTIRLADGRTIASGGNIVPAGAEARAGAVLVAAGTRVRTPQVAVAAMSGYASLEVFARPRVAILATGDELVPVEATPSPSQIRNSNTHSIASQVIGAGGEPQALPPVADDPVLLERAIVDALGSADLLLLSGGVSMGKFDFVEQVLLGLGAEFYFTGAKIQPGKPVVFGKVQGRYFFGLPGNPVSTMVTFLLFVAPLLRALGGEEARPRFVQARLASEIKSVPGLTRFLPARLTRDVSGPSVAAIPWQGSGDLAATARADCFIVAPADATEGPMAGDTVTVLLGD